MVEGNGSDLAMPDAASMEALESGFKRVMDPEFALVDKMKTVEKQILVAAEAAFVKKVRRKMLEDSFASI